MNIIIRSISIGFLLLVTAFVNLSAQTVSTVTELITEIGSASSGATIILDAGFVSAPATITLPNADVTVDGGNVIWNTGNINITGSGTGHLTFKNLKMNGTGISGRLFINSASNGKLTLEASEFYNAQSGAIDISTSVDASTVISYTKIYDNTVVNSAPAVWVGASSNLVINNSTIENNIGTGAGYQCGAVASNFHSGNLEINNTVFRNNVNKCLNSGLIGGGGGAMSLHYFRGRLLINESLFQGNKTNGEGVSIASTYDGGAIYVFDGSQGAIININKTTFDGNLAYDDGGAMMIQATNSPGLTTTITNCTFYNNKAYGLNGGNRSGGAIQFFRNGGTSAMSNTILTSTFVGNVSGSQSTNVTQQGGAVALSGSSLSPSVTYSGSLFVGNNVYGSNGQLNTASNYKDISNSTTTQAGTGNVINVDKGSTPAYTAEMVLGKNYTFCENLSEIKAGVEDEIIKTIPIKPEGIADVTYNGTTTLPATDQRNFTRNKDQGAIEMAWVRFNAGDGIWTGLDDDHLYAGMDYYESSSSKTQYYYKITYLDGTVAEPTATLTPPANKVFDKWVLDDGVENTEWNPSDAVTGNVLVKALWKSTGLTVTYHPNGGIGAVKTANCAADNTHTIFSHNDIYLGFSSISPYYSFIEWNTAADGSGTSYSAGYAATFTTNMELYAQWKSDMPIPGIQIEDMKPVCSNETEIQIPYEILYPEHTMEYVVYFSEEAKNVGFVDKTEYSVLPDRYVTIPVPAGVPQGIYKGSIFLRCDLNPNIISEYPFEIEILGAVRIIRQPVSQVLSCEGGNFNLSVEATGDNLTYQWYHNDQKIEGATSGQYWNVVSPETLGYYYVKVMGTCDTLVSDKANVKMYDRTQIVRQPVSKTVACEGGNFNLSVGATGDNLTYQWYYNGKKIEGAVSDSYGDVISAQTVGIYYVEVTGSCGTVVSEEVTVGMYAGTGITVQPITDFLGCKGELFVLSVEATGENLTYQWYYNGQKITGATSAHYENNISSGTTGYYHVVVKDACDSIISDRTNVVMKHLTILMKWDDVLYIENVGSRYVKFQWYKNDEVISVHGASMYYTDPNGLYGTYFVRAYYSDGTYDETCPVTFTRPVQSSSLSVYPNPVSSFGQLTVKNDDLGESYIGSRIIVYNLMGQKVYFSRVTGPETVIQMKVTEGTYLMHITSPRGEKTVKKIIVK